MGEQRCSKPDTGFGFSNGPESELEEPATIGTAAEAAPSTRICGTPEGVP